MLLLLLSLLFLLTDVPPGFYLKGPGQVSPCPKGEYKSGYDAVAACSKCAEGVTTLAEASTNQAACVSVLPTYYPASIQTLVVDSVNVGDYVATTKKCPQKFYCPGGEPSAAFSPSSPTSLSGTTVVACPKQTWTEGTGASDATQCSEWQASRAASRVWAFAAVGARAVCC